MNSDYLKKMAFASIVIFVIPITFAGNIWAKNLYVSTTGNDSVTYENNDINNPWRSVSKAWTSALTDDIVYYRAGTYTITARINVSNGGHNVHHLAYPDETVTWSSSLSTSTIEIGEPDITVDGINVSSAASGGDAGFFRIGWNSNISSPSGFTLKNCTGTTSGAGDNTGIVHARPNRGQYADNALIENCRFIGPGSTAGTTNSTAIITFQARNWTIKNCEISDFHTGLFIDKHPNDKAYRTAVVENCYIYNCGDALYTHANYTTFRNNIFAGNVVTGYDGGPNAAGDCGSDYNTFSHNTITGRFTMEDQTRSGDDLPGEQYNTVTNNIIRGEFLLHESHTVVPFNDTTDYNLYRATNPIRYISTTYSLASWQSYYGQDDNSLSGTPAFVGGSTPTTISGFALTVGSPGKGSASNSKDIGADVTYVGVLVVLPEISSQSDDPAYDTTPPVQPSVVNVLIVN